MGWCYTPVISGCSIGLLWPLAVGVICRSPQAALNYARGLFWEAGGQDWESTKAKFAPSHLGYGVHFVVGAEDLNYWFVLYKDMKSGEKV